MKEKRTVGLRMLSFLFGQYSLREDNKWEIDAQWTRMNASHNCFIRTCCRQEIDQLRAEKDAIEAEVVD